MASDIFLRLDKAKSGAPLVGESTDEVCKGWIEVSSYDLSTTQPVEGSRSTSGSATSGRADHEDVGFAKQMDIATPYLMFCCCAGDMIMEGEIAHFTQVNNKKVLFAHYVMTSIVITECSLSGSDGVPEETLKLSYGTIGWKYWKVDHDNGTRAEPAHVKGWNVLKNQESTPGAGVAK